MSTICTSNADERLHKHVHTKKSRQYRILCVDDDDDLTRIIKARFRTLNVEVTRACGGKEGLKAARSHRPDAIITDLGMPNGDGEYLLRRLKNRPSTASIPVVVISGVGDESRKADVYRIGAAAILHKPFKFNELIAVLDPHLDWNCLPDSGSNKLIQQRCEDLSATEAPAGIPGRRHYRVEGAHNSRRAVHFLPGS